MARALPVPIVGFVWACIFVSASHGFDEIGGRMRRAGRVWDFHAEEKHAVASALHEARVLLESAGADCRWGTGKPYPEKLNLTLEVPRFEGSPVEGSHSHAQTVTLQLTQKRTGKLPVDLAKITTYRGIGHAGPGSWSSVTLLPRCRVHALLFDDESGLTVVDDFGEHEQHVTARHGRVLDAPAIVAYRSEDMLSNGLMARARDLDFLNDLLFQQRPNEKPKVGHLRKLRNGGKIGTFKLDNWNLPSTDAKKLDFLSGCPSHKIGQDGLPHAKIGMRIGVAMDHTMVKRYGDSGSDAFLQKMMNDVGALFAAQLGIELTLAYVEKRLDDKKPKEKDLGWNGCHTSGLAGQFEEFSLWVVGPHASDYNVPQEEKAGAWMLLSNCNYGGLLGLGKTGEICRDKPFSFLPKTNKIGDCTREYVDKGYKCRIPTGGQTGFKGNGLWLTFAHELGHVFGANHNCKVRNGFCDPRAGTGIMSYNPPTPRFFHNGNGEGRKMCSILKNRMQDSKWCFYDTTPKCGNGVIDVGEECDDSSSCCDSSTCKLKGECSGGSCCTSECKISTELQCSPNKPGEDVFSWHEGEFGECKAECIKSRTVECRKGALVKVEDSKCDISQKPEVTAPCDVNKCTSAQWTEIEGYGQCSADCGGGTQSRTVKCVLQGKITDAS
eukprot:g5277.t1